MWHCSSRRRTSLRLAHAPSTASARRGAVGFFAGLFAAEADEVGHGVDGQEHLADFVYGAVGVGQQQHLPSLGQKGCHHAPQCTRGLACSGRAYEQEQVAGGLGLQHYSGIVVGGRGDGLVVGCVVPGRALAQQQLPSPGRGMEESCQTGEHAAKARVHAVVLDGVASVGRQEAVVLLGVAQAQHEAVGFEPLYAGAEHHAVGDVSPVVVASVQQDGIALSEVGQGQLFVVGVGRRQGKRQHGAFGVGGMVVGDAQAVEYLARLSLLLQRGKPQG